MKATKFEAYNTNYAKDQSQYITLPAHKTPKGLVTSCWTLSWWERLKVIVSGKIYLRIMTFNKPLQPLKLTTDLELTEYE